METLYAEEKAALLLMALSPQDAQNVLDQLGLERGNRLRAEIERLEQMPQSKDYQDQVLREFDDLLREVEASPAALEGASAAANPNPAAAIQTEPPKELAASLPDEAKGDAVAALRGLDYDKLGQALQGEQARIVALVLDALEVNQAGEVLKRLPAQTRDEVSLQLGRDLQVAPEVLQRIARALYHKSQQLEEARPPQTEQTRYKKMADMLRLMPKPDRLAVVAALDQGDPTMAAGVKEFLYQFDDILRIEDRSMQKVLSEVDSKNLAIALKGAPDAIKDKVMNNLSKRARETLGEEMEFLGTVAGAQIEQARKVVVEVIQRLDQAGELVMIE